MGEKKVKLVEIGGNDGREKVEIVIGLASKVTNKFANLSEDTLG